LKKLPIIIFLNLFYNCHASDLLSVDPEQRANLGVEVTSVSSVSKGSGHMAPARVVIPTGKELIITSPRAGTITTLYVSVGDRVDEGQIIAEVQSPEFITLQSNYLDARSAFDLSNTKYERDKTLHEEGIISQSRLQETEAVYRERRAHLEETRFILSMTGLNNREIDEIGNGYTFAKSMPVRSPGKTSILERYASVGEHVEMMGPIFRLADISSLWLEISVPQEIINEIHVGSSISVLAVDIIAKVIAIGATVDSATQTILVRASFDQDELLLRPGQFVTVSLDQIQGHDAGLLTVPGNAVIRREGKSYVFIEAQDGFSIRAVTALGIKDGAAFIKGDLPDNAQVVSKGLVALKALWLEGE
jgi:cobalt-zinc-cadmium efflux system membrane fusion protein